MPETTPGNAPGNAPGQWIGEDDLSGYASPVGVGNDFGGPGGGAPGGPFGEDTDATPAAPVGVGNDFGGPGGGAPGGPLGEDTDYPALATVAHPVYVVTYAGLQSTWYSDETITLIYAIKDALGGDVAPPDGSSRIVIYDRKGVTAFALIPDILPSPPAHQQELGVDVMLSPGQYTAICQAVIGGKRKDSSGLLLTIY